MQLSFKSEHVVDLYIFICMQCTEVLIVVFNFHFGILKLSSEFLFDGLLYLSSGK